jgi:hypothetical protein
MEIALMSVNTPEEAKEFVRRWMVDRGVFRSDISDKNKDTVHFSYEGTCNTGVNFSIQQPTDMTRVVGVTTRLLFDPHHLKVLVDFGQQRRNDFLKKLSGRLLFARPSFVFGPKPESPEWIFFLKEISYDELTEGRLIEAVDQISRAVIWASSIIVGELGEPKKE